MKAGNDLSYSGDSRQKLMEAGTELFSSKGFHAVSVREICDRAQVNVSLISYYFQGKDGLLAAILEEMTQKGAQQIEHYLEKFDSPEDFKIRLQGFLGGMIQFYLENSNLLRLFLDQLEKEQPDAEKVFSETLLRTFEILKKFLREGREARLVRASTSDDRILLIQVVAPFFNLIRNESCALKFYKASLKSQQFRTELIEQITGGLLA